MCAGMLSAICLLLKHKDVRGHAFSCGRELASFVRVSAGAAKRFFSIQGKEIDASFHYSQWHRSEKRPK